MTLADDPGFPVLLQHLAGRGIPPLDMYKDRCLLRRLAVRMRACGAGTLLEYVAVLEAQPEEVARLLDALTINVTRFFRNSTAWARLAEALPRPAPGRVMTGWSAGCASGEEAYTLAMIFADAWGTGRCRVEATDVDPECLARGRKGWYRLAAFEEVPPHLVQRWTETEADGRRIVGPLRARVRWQRHDLGTDEAPGPPYDVIVCRNVVIYFAVAVQRRLYERFAYALRPGGLLFLGKVELLAGSARALFEPVDLRERIFRRVAQ